MKLTFDQIRSQREVLLDQMRSIDRLRRGTLSKQFFKKVRNGATVTSGPYYVLQCIYQGKKYSERISADEAATIGEQVDNYRRFQELADEFVNLTEQLTQLETQNPGAKKNSRNQR